MFSSVAFSQDEENNQKKPDINFIASSEELTVALNEKCQKDGLCISAKFYETQNDSVKKIIKNLVLETLTCENKPVVVYGKQLNPLLLEELFGHYIGSGKPALFLGWKYQIAKRFVSGVAAWNEENFTEERMRFLIKYFWDSII